MEYSRYFQDLPKPRYPSHAKLKRKRKFELFNPSQAMLEELSVWNSLREAAQARCSSAALPSDYIIRPVALVQHCSGRGAAGMQQQAGRLRSISGMCVA